MAESSQTGSLQPVSDVLSPLPTVLHQGLTVVAVMASLSLFASSITVAYLTFKLVRWRVKLSRERRCTQHAPMLDLSLGLPPSHFGGRDEQDDEDRRKPNQFLVLLYNLLIADMHQAGSFIITGVWVARDSIEVGHPACFLQGWLVSTGDVAGGLFLSAIAIHTYLTVVCGRKLSQQAVYLGVIGIWFFTYLISALGIAITHNGSSGGGYYVRAGAWCWINVHYENLRLLTHYLFIFISLAVVSILYTLIFLCLRRRQSRPSLEAAHSQVVIVERRPSSRSEDHASRKSVLDVRTSITQVNLPPSAPDAGNGHHPAFLLYPLIYVACTAPLALGRIAAMAGATIPLGYFCAAGALITSNGWLDVLLWGITRRTLLFGADIDAEEVGLSTFTFMRTPPGRKYGNMVWVQGASRGVREDEKHPAQGQDDAKDGHGWWRAARWHQERGHKRPSSRDRRTGSMGGQLRSHQRLGSRTISQESLRGGHDLAIQMDIVTTVEVEMDAERMDMRNRGYPLSQNNNSAKTHVHYEEFEVDSVFLSVDDVLSGSRTTRDA